MSFGEGVKVALFVMSLVFSLLATIYALIKLATAVIRRYFNDAAKN
jgi:Na+-transporting methylmalonyl-CoA/oxaloacetate decarboxylase gamma subunit